MPEVQFLGHACFRIRGRDGTIVCDPYHRSIGLDLGRPTASIVTVSHHHPDHDNSSAVRPLRDRVFVVDGPGEYEIGGVLITGVRTFHDQVKGAERGFNTVYIIHLDDLVFCHLGDLGHELTTSQLEEIGSNVDVLFVPVGGGETIGPALASNVISQIEPHFVIPMHYAMGQTNFDPPLAPIERFISEMGLKEYTAEEKFVINANALPDDEEQTRIVFLRPIHG